jgi:hypothetical protein
MITDHGEQRALSNLGWVDHGAVWLFDSGADESRLLPLSDAKSLNLLAGSGGYFAAVHHWVGERLDITVQRFDHPDQVVGRIEVDSWEPTISGDETAWENVPSLFVGYLNQDVTGAAGYFTVRRLGASVELARLDWFGADYDHAYQGVISAVELPESGNILFGVQRSSELVLFDPLAENVARRVSLAGRGGNPHPQLSAVGPTAWTVDHDTVVRLDRETWEVAKAIQFQPAANGTAMFVGDLWLPNSEEAMVLPRPGSGDVLILDPVTLGVRSTVTLGSQPLEAVLLRGGRVVARDWKTGDVLTSGVRSE